MTKPIDRVKDTFAYMEEMGLCQWLLDSPRFTYPMKEGNPRYRCKKAVLGDFDYSQAGDEPCTKGDWATCPLNDEVMLEAARVRTAKMKAKEAW